MRERDPEQSKKRILRAAEQEFAEKGFFGARVDEIAAAAEINKRMIYAYFKDKENLYKQVLFQVYGRMEQAEQVLLERDLGGAALIEAIIYTYFDFLRDNNTFVHILMWENLNRGRCLREMESSKIERPTICMIVEKLKQGMADGVFRQDIDPWQTALSLITVCFANFSNQYTLSTLFRTDLTDPAAIEERKRHTAQLMLAYLCK